MVRLSGSIAAGGPLDKIVNEIIDNLVGPGGDGVSTKVGKPRSEISAAVEIAHCIEEEIIIGALKPRERLVEDELMRRFGETRYIVRQALAQLEALGILTKEHHRGAVVRDFSAREVAEIYAMRELLQGEAARTIPMPASPALLAALRDIQARHAQAHEHNDFRTFYRLNNEFHTTLFAACGNTLLVQAIDTYTWMSHSIPSDRISLPKLRRRAIAEHQAMIEALAAGDRDALARLCIEHMRISRENFRGASGWIEDDGA
jgi:DNA-binding GntR family transcriptional regulator